MTDMIGKQVDVGDYLLKAESFSVLALYKVVNKFESNGILYWSIVNQHNNYSANNIVNADQYYRIPREDAMLLTLQKL